MGLYDKLQTRLTKAFDGRLKDAITSFEFVNRKNSTYDPSTGVVGDVEQRYASRGVLSSFTKLDISDTGGKIDENDKELLVLDVDMPSVEVETNFKVDVSGKEYLIVDIDVDPAGATHTMRLR